MKQVAATMGAVQYLMLRWYLLWDIMRSIKQVKVAWIISLLLDIKEGTSV